MRDASSFLEVEAAINACDDIGEILVDDVVDDEAPLKLPNMLEP